MVRAGEDEDDDEEEEEETSAKRASSSTNSSGVRGVQPRHFKISCPFQKKCEVNIIGNIE
jgi:hypothetical protein